METVPFAIANSTSHLLIFLALYIISHHLYNYMYLYKYAPTHSGLRVGLSRQVALRRSCWGCFLRVARHHESWVCQMTCKCEVSRYPNGRHGECWLQSWMQGELTERFWMSKTLVKSDGSSCINFILSMPQISLKCRWCTSLGDSSRTFLALDVYGARPGGLVALLIWRTQQIGHD